MKFSYVKLRNSTGESSLCVRMSYCVSHTDGERHQSSFKMARHLSKKKFY